MTFNSAPFDDIKMALNGTFEKTTTLAVKLHGLVPTTQHSDQTEMQAGIE